MKTNLNQLLFICFLGFNIFSTTNAWSITLTQGDIIEFEFSLSGPPTSGTDVIEVSFGSGTIITPFSDYEIKLFNGDTLLGSWVNPYLFAGPAFFTDAGSLWTFGSPSVIDFGSILDGSIDGHAELAISTGEISFTSDPFVEVLRAISASGGIGGGVLTNATPAQLQSSLPEPASILLLVLGLVGLSGLSNHCRTKKSTLARF